MNLSTSRTIPLFLRIVTSPITVALVITLAVLPFTASYFPKYRAKVISSGLVERQDALVTYFDINKDGRSEQFISFINPQGKPTFKVTDQDGLVIDQQEYEGNTFPVKCPLIFSDLNRNSYPEVIVFIQRNDSLFLTILEYRVNLEKEILADVFVTMVRNIHGKPNYNVYVGPLTDLDNDSSDEVIFSVMAGYPITPRNIYIYYFKREELLTSGFTGATNTVSAVVDLNNDGKKELLMNKYAPGNMEDSLIEGKDDKSVSFNILDEHLEPLFPPVVFRGEYSSLSCQPACFDTTCLIAVLYSHKGKPKNDPLLQLYDIQGKRKASLVLSTDKKLKRYIFISLSGAGKSLNLLDQEGAIVSYDKDLRVTGKAQTSLVECSAPHAFDLDDDGHDEKVFTHNYQQKITITRDDLSDPVSLDLPHEALFTGMSLKKNTGSPDEIYIQYSQKYFIATYGSNPFYSYRFLFYLALFLGLVGFAYFVQFLQRLRMREKHRTERNLVALQLRLVKKQVDPHFLFNVITTLSYNLLSKDPEDAYTGITRLARFMRSAVEWGDKITRPLKDELEVVQTYLELFRNQHPGKFEFEIECGDMVDQNQLIPVMIIHNFIEYSIRHGIDGRDGKGRIIIRLLTDSKATYVEIEGNGVGKINSKETDTSGTGKGLDLMLQYLELLNKLSDKKITFAISGLTDEHSEPSGMLVKIVLPLDVKYSLYE